MLRLLFAAMLPMLFIVQIEAQHSIAREWNELTLESIRNDLARPTVHARNLFHTSIAMYDVWAAYDDVSSPYFLGQTVDGYTCSFSGIPIPDNTETAREEAISFAVYRLLRHRFQSTSSVVANVFPQYDNLMATNGYDINNTSIDYSTGDPAALGNYIAQELIAFGLLDGSNEQNAYVNQFYSPINPDLVVELSGNPDITDLNRWQPLTLDFFIDQSGNVFPTNTPPFLSPEWGEVSPFALSATDKTINTRDGYNYEVYHDQGAPPSIDITSVAASEEYKWNFSLVSMWSSHLDTADQVMWDISPASIGNIQSYPTDFAGMQAFYDDVNGGDPGTGHALNPITGMSYTPQMVRRADYARVLAEFWADGPESETPPGHWYTILNYVSDHPMFEKRFEGASNILDDLEWDIKSYFTLGGAMHDAAITAWGNKGWYDYIRPVSAIRAMAEYGQCSDPAQASYHPGGLPLIPDFIELIEAGDVLSGASNQHVGKVKVYAWRGPNYISNPLIDEAGVGWIRAEDWWPYQRPTFVTPNFAGYVSGHSTFSRAAAEVMTALTGNAFFPGGMGEFSATQNQFLVFEEGPSEDITLQWATYRDASDQCSLSRIWGGIHPPADDIPGRLMGIEIGVDAFVLAKQYIDGAICVDYRVVTDTSIGGSVCKADNTILSDTNIQSGANVNFKAGQLIKLDAGFQSNVQADFSAEIEDCQ